MYAPFSDALLHPEQALPTMIDPASTAGFQVYRNNVFSSLIQALSEIFPICRRYLAESFETLAASFIREYPPHGPVLREYGEDFSNYLTVHPQLEDRRWLAELAQLEYQLLQLTHQREMNVLSPTQIQQQLQALEDPAQSYWTLVDTCQLYQPSFAVGTLYHEHVNGNVYPQPVDKVDYLLLAKQGLYGQLFCLQPAQWHLLVALANNVPLEQACHGLDNVSDETLPILLAELMQLPVFVAITATD